MSDPVKDNRSALGRLIPRQLEELGGALGGRIRVGIRLWDAIDLKHAAKRLETILSIGLAELDFVLRYPRGRLRPSSGNHSDNFAQRGEDN
jgi:hypothetical protein